jgi:hypothetical protein
MEFKDKEKRAAGAAKKSPNYCKVCALVQKRRGGYLLILWAAVVFALVKVKSLI